MIRRPPTPPLFPSTPSFRSAVRPSISESGEARVGADSEHSPVARPAPRPRAEERGGAPLGAPAPAHPRPLAGRRARCASPPKEEHPSELPSPFNIVCPLLLL